MLVVQIGVQKFQDGRRPQFWKPLHRYILAAVRNSSDRQKVWQVTSIVPMNFTMSARTLNLGAYYFANDNANIIRTKLASVSVHRKSHRFKTANIEILICILSA